MQGFYLTSLTAKITPCHQIKCQGKSNNKHPWNNPTQHIIKHCAQINKLIKLLDKRLQNFKNFCTPMNVKTQSNFRGKVNSFK